jgi:hypothetical protein
MLAGVAGQKSRRKPFVRIAQFLRLPAANDAAGSWPRVIVGSLYPDVGDRQRCHRAFGHGPLNVALDRLMRQSEPTPQRKGVFLP